MTYSRTTSVEGIEVIETIPVRIYFNYTSTDAPTYVSFSVTEEGKPTVYGSCDTTGITTYNVNGGIITDEFLTELETKCKEALINYETI